MTVPNHKYSAPRTLEPISDERIHLLIERVLDCAVIEVIEQDDEAAKALIALVDAVAGEESADMRRMIALEISAAFYVRTGAFYTAVKDLTAGARAEYLTPRGTPRTRGKKQLSQAI